MKYRPTVILVLSKFAVAQSSLITGAVVDENGTPVMAVKGEAYPLDIGNSGRAVQRRDRRKQPFRGYTA